MAKSTKKPLTDVRKMPSQKRSAETLGYILEAGTRIIDEAGFEGVSTTGVAKLAGVSVGTLYQYFPNKEALVAAIIESCARGEIEMVEQAIFANIEKPFPTICREAIKIMFAYHAKHPNRQLVVAKEIMRIGREDIVHDYELQVVTLVEQFLSANRDKIAIKNTETAAFIIVYNLENIFRTISMVRPEYFTDEEFIEETITSVMRYIMPHENN